MLRGQRFFEDMTRARTVCGGIELPLIPLSLVDGTESRPMVGIASTRKHKDRADLPIGIHPIYAQMYCMSRVKWRGPIESNRFCPDHSWTHATSKHMQSGKRKKTLYAAYKNGKLSKLPHAGTK